MLRTDIGTEFCNKNLSNYFKREGIIHQTSVVYCPEQNGLAERVNRTIFEKARAMLQESGLSERYWGVAVMTAIYLKNRSPTSALSGGIPECEWTGSNIDLSHLRVFGCIAYSFVPDVKRQKLDAKAKQYIFVGYGETCKGYRLSDPFDPKKVIYSRNVMFHEDKFYNKSNFKKVEHDRANNFIFYNVLNYNFSNNDTYYNNDIDIEINDKSNEKDCDISDKCNSKSNSSSNNVSDADVTPPPWSPLSEHYCTDEDSLVGEDSSLPEPEIGKGDEDSSHHHR